MCFWLITACLGLLPTTTVVNVINPGQPAPIITPTTAATTTTTRGTPMMPPSMMPNSTNMFPPGMMIPNSTGIPGGMNPMPGMMPPNTPTYPPMNPGYPMQPPNGNFPPPNGNLISTAAPYPQYPAYNPGGVLTVPIICQNPYAVCVTNPNQYGGGFAGQAPAIDPRLGTTPRSYGQYAGAPSLPIMAYSGQIPSTNVNFPRYRRGVEHVSWNSSDTGHRIAKRQTGCTCVAAGTCPTGTNYGAGLIDFRIVTPQGGGGPAYCGAGQELCCGGGGAGQNVVACGVRQQTPATAVQPAAGQASFGKFPWQAIILTRQNDYVAGGVLVDQMNVITVVHRLQPYVVAGAAPNVKVRLGEWDAAGAYEPVPFQEYSVLRVFTHPSFNAATLQYDVAVLRLSVPVPLTPQPGAAVTVNRACLPASSALVYNGQRCWVAGWGKNAFGTAGVYQQILKEVEVPVVDAASCQAALRSARLGPNYVLDTTSFMCAGGEVNKDSCTGDGGSGLVCLAGGQWTVAGLVAWGLGCAAGGVPGVYVNVAALSPWINQQIATV